MPLNFSRYAVENRMTSRRLVLGPRYATPFSRTHPTQLCRVIWTAIVSDGKKKRERKGREWETDKPKKNLQARQVKRRLFSKPRFFSGTCSRQGPCCCTLTAATGPLQGRLLLLTGAAPAEGSLNPCNWLASPHTVVIMVKCSLPSCWDLLSNILVCFWVSLLAARSWKSPRFFFFLV